jgi:glycerol kinase
VSAHHVLAIDQGTTSSRAIVFDPAGAPVAISQRELEQHYPRAGWVEHDPETIWADVVAVAREALAKAGLEASRIAAVGITNQRESTVLWERASGRAVHPVIVWQDRRTAGRCRELSGAGHDALVRERTGLVIDPYFSATKLAWLLDQVAGVRAAAERGELAFGTIDSFLLWRLTGGAVHATDATNASRTMLYDIHRQDWDDDLLALLGIPRAVLPEVKDCSAMFGTTPAELFGAPLPITGIAGDQQAATVGQACFRPGMLKSTYGTGCFALLNTGAKAVTSRHRLLTTTAYRLRGKTTYALEGSIFVAGAAVQWLRDGLKLIGHAGESEALAAGIHDTGGV